MLDCLAIAGRLGHEVPRPRHGRLVCMGMKTKPCSNQPLEPLLVIAMNKTYHQCNRMPQYCNCRRKKNTKPMWKGKVASRVRPVTGIAR